MEARTGRIPLGGWATFAAVLFLVVGAINVTDGILGLAEDDHLVDNAIFAGLKFWGVVWVAFGALQILTAYLIFGRSAMGQMLGIFLAAFNLFAHIFFIPAFPVWSVIVMAIDALVIYGLTVHGEAFE